jgi:hypothetical protein
VHDIATERVRGLAGDFRDVIAGKYRERPMHEVEQLPLRGPVAGSSYLKAAQMPWQPTEDKKFWIKPLYEDADKGEKTLLIRQLGELMTGHAARV